MSDGNKNRDWQVFEHLLQRIAEILWQQVEQVRQPEG